MNDHHSPRPSCRQCGSPSRTIAALLLATLGLLVVPAGANATSVTDAGEGFPLSVNSSDQVLMAKLVFEEEEGKTVENIKGPWSIWAGGKSTPLAPLNGGPETSEVVLGEPEHNLFLYRLNDAGVAGGTSSVTSEVKEGKEHTVERAAYYTPDGVGHEVPPLHETITNSKGEPVIVGAIGTGIDEAGDVSGLGVEQVGEHARSRGFFSAGGTAHPSVVGESDGPWTEIFGMNESGAMYGAVSQVKVTPIEEGKTEEEPVEKNSHCGKTPVPAQRSSTSTHRSRASRWPTTAAYLATSRASSCCANPAEPRPKSPA